MPSALLLGTDQARQPPNLSWTPETLDAALTPPEALLHGVFQQDHLSEPKFRAILDQLGIVYIRRQTP